MRPALRMLKTLTSTTVLLIASALTAHAQAVTFDLEMLGEPGSPGWESRCNTELSLMHGAGHAFTPETPRQKETGAEFFFSDSTPQLEPCFSADPLECMHRVTIDTDNHYPNAVCSDGSPGTFYIRPGRGNDVNKWIIHLQGGSSCSTYEECVSRWCGTQGVYSAAKMSTDWDDPTADASDVLQKGVALGMRTINSPQDNGFEDWTQVYVYYCSSDNWQGRKTQVALTNETGLRTVHLSARGHTILAIMRKMLRHNGPSGTDWFPTALSSVPDLDDATDIIFSGTSSGATGAVHNADWFLSMFPRARTALVLDGAMNPTLDAAAAHSIEMEWPEGSGTYVSYEDALGNQLRESWMPGGYNNAINAFIDETCDWHQSSHILGFIPACWHSAGVLMGWARPRLPYVTTPTFVRLSLTDNVLLEIARLAFRVRDASGGLLTLTEQTFADLMRDTLVALHDEAPAVDGSFAPQCGAHVGLSTHMAFYLDTTEDVIEDASGDFVPQGVVSTFHDALWEWYDVSASGPQETRYIDSSDLSAPTADCSH